MASDLGLFLRIITFFAPKYRLFPPFFCLFHHVKPRVLAF